MTHDSPADEGFTLIELLVVIILLGILGTVTTAGIVQAFSTTRQDSARAASNEGLQTQLDRLTRELRVADPLRSVSTSDIIADIYRNGCQRIEWRINAGRLQQRTLRYSVSTSCRSYPATVAATSDSGYVTTLSNVSSLTPFSFRDHSGAVLATPTVATTVQVVVTLTQTQTEGRPALTASAAAYLRNAS